MKLPNYVVSMIVVGCLLPVANCQGQKLKLPNFLPFKKKSEEVRPIQLSDQGNQRSQSQANKDKSVFDFLNAKTSSQSRTGADFSQKPKSFFAKTGDEIEGFAAGTKKFFSDAWNPPKAKKAWWNEEPASNPAKKQAFFHWPGSKSSDAVQPPPMPRTAQQYHPGQPRHRFK